MYVYCIIYVLSVGKNCPFFGQNLPVLRAKIARSKIVRIVAPNFVFSIEAQASADHFSLYRVSLACKMYS